MKGLCEFVDMLNGASVAGELWIDGGFTTEKSDPKDVDIVLMLDGTLYDQGSDSFRSAIDLVNSNLKKTLKCDSYVCMLYPVGHPLHVEGLWWRTWYHKRWGFSREEDPKGIVVISLGGVTP